jgi:hypothetical protein
LQDVGLEVQLATLVPLVRLAQQGQLAALVPSDPLAPRALMVRMVAMAQLELLDQQALPDLTRLDISRSYSARTT